MIKPSFEYPVCLTTTGTLAVAVLSIYSQNSDDDNFDTVSPFGTQTVKGSLTLPALLTPQTTNFAAITTTKQPL